MEFVIHSFDLKKKENIFFWNVNVNFFLFVYIIYILNVGAVVAQRVNVVGFRVINFLHFILFYYY